MAQLRLVRPEEMQAAIQLADDVFRDADHKSMGSAYPHSFSPSLMQSYGAFADGALVAFVGFVPMVIRIGDARLSVYGVGGVCTHPDHRGQGYAGAILELLDAHSRKAGAPLLIVSGDRPLYQRFGCRPFGHVDHVSLTPDKANELLAHADLADVTFRSFAPEDWLAMKRLADQRTVAYEQSVWDLASLVYAEPVASNAKLVHQVTVAERGGQMVGFAVVGVADGERTPRRSPVLIEWAGDPRYAVAAAAHTMLETASPSLHVVMPWHEQALRTCMCDVHGLESNRTKLGCTAAVIDPAVLLQQLAPYIQARDTAAYAALQRLPGDAAWPADRFISLLFDDDADTRAAAGIDNAADVLPIPFPYTSGLNFI